MHTSILQGRRERITTVGGNQRFADRISVAATIACKERGHWGNEDGRGRGGGAPKKIF